MELEATSHTVDWLVAKYGIETNPLLERCLRRILHRLSTAAYHRALEREVDNKQLERFRDYPWHTIVLDSDAPYAFSGGGGAIILTRGVFHLTGTEAELAAILSHEMAHQILEHPRIALAEADFTSAGPRFAFSLEQELAADALGAKLLSVARYDPQAALSALSLAYRLSEQSVSDPAPAWLDSRTAHLRAVLNAMKPTFPATDTTREFNKLRRRLAFKKNN